MLCSHPVCPAIRPFLVCVCVCLWQVVRLEELCWCLDGPALCEAVTGEKWTLYKSKLDQNPELQKQFDRRVELATYFVGQLLLHAAMCSGRSYNCIDWYVVLFLK